MISSYGLFVTTKTEIKPTVMTAFAVFVTSRFIAARSAFAPGGLSAALRRCVNGPYHLPALTPSPSADTMRSVQMLRSTTTDRGSGLLPLGDDEVLTRRAAVARAVRGTRDAMRCCGKGGFRPGVAEVPIADGSLWSYPALHLRGIAPVTVWRLSRPGQAWPSEPVCRSRTGEPCFHPRSSA
jgi:hypothetical protein